MDVPSDWSEGVIGTEKEGQELGASQGAVKEAADMACPGRLGISVTLDAL